jgi:hypothetical protein
MKRYKEIANFNSDPDYYELLAHVESSGNPNAQAKTSSAAGLFQFTEGTWKGLVKEAGLDYTLEDRFDPEKSRKVVEIFTGKNEKYLKKVVGDEVGRGDLYLAHFLGRGGAKNLLSVDPTTPVAEVVSPAALKANKGVFFNKDGSLKTAGDIRNWARVKFKERPLEFKKKVAPEVQPKDERLEYVTTNDKTEVNSPTTPKVEPTIKVSEGTVKINQDQIHSFLGEEGNETKEQHSLSDYDRDLLEKQNELSEKIKGWYEQQENKSKADLAQVALQKKKQERDFLKDLIMNSGSQFVEQTKRGSYLDQEVQQFQDGGTHRDPYQEPKNFLKDYVRSDKHSERLKDTSFSEFENRYREIMESNLDSSRTYEIEGSEKQNIGNRLNRTKQGLKNPTEAYMGTHYDPVSNSVFMVGNEFNNDYTAAHEYSHNALKGLKLPPENIELLERRLKTSGLTGSHDLDPKEAKADIDAFRYLLNSKGIYNAGEEDFNKDHLKKAKEELKDNFIFNRLIKKSNDDEGLIEWMNKIATTNNGKGLTYAQGGGEFDNSKMQMLDEVIINFKSGNDRVVSSKNDPRYQAYNDSLAAYNGLNNVVQAKRKDFEEYADTYEKMYKGIIADTTGAYTDTEKLEAEESIKDFNRRRENNKKGQYYNRDIYEREAKERASEGRNYNVPNNLDYYKGNSTKYGYHYSTDDNTHEKNHPPMLSDYTLAAMQKGIKPRYLTNDNEGIGVGIFDKPKEKIFIEGTPEAEIAKKQMLLKKRGTYTGEIDGVWGEMSDIALANTDFKSKEGRPIFQDLDFGKYSEYFEIVGMDGDTTVVRQTNKNPHNKHTVKPLLEYINKNNKGKKFKLR